ncbi:MAG: DMT family transporter [Planctomycetes bacterium]|nr:DMT family transporter [Planctomycetota bacterium]
MAFQIVVNTQLRTYMNSPMQATLVSLAVGTVLALIYCLIAGYSWPSFARLGETPWWAWIGGFFGVLFLWCGVVASPHLGVALTFGLVVTGQMATATIIDHFGLLGARIQPVSLGKIAGVVLIVIGVATVAAFRE